MAQADRFLTQSACNHIIIYWAQVIGSWRISVDNELTAQPSNIWSAFAVAVCSVLSETLHLPQLQLYKSAICYIVQQ